MNKSVGIILIATGEKYHKYIWPQIASIKENFKPSNDVTIFLWTDAKHKYVNNQFYMKDLGHPGSTLWRYNTIIKEEKELMKMDYLYYMDVDMLVVDKVGEEILSDLVATLHPGFVNKQAVVEDRPKSLAYIKEDENKRYFCGGFNGGSSFEYLRMAKQLAENISKDHENGIVAVWHDESHMNRYMIDNPPTKILSPSYCYPEPPEDKLYMEQKWTEQYTPKIYAIDKTLRTKLVSIVIPCYEQAQFLSHAIESALAQTYANVEVIVVDDGSPDNASEVAKRYPVTLVRQKNKGLSAARNAGIEVATGEYFLPLDSDDMLDKNYLKETVSHLVSDSKVGVVYTSMAVMNEQYVFVRYLEPPSEVLLENLRYNNQLYICSLIRMETLKQCSGYNTNMIHGYEDWNLWIDIAKRGWKFKHVPLPLFKYMVKPKSMATVAFTEWHQWNIDQIKKNHPSVYVDETKNEQQDQ